MRAVIVDDEPLLRMELDKMLADLWPELEVVGKAGNGKQALALIEEYQPDVLFLDIRMPLMDGMAVAKAVNAKPSSQTAIVFTTAYDSYAIEAFEQQAVDYLLKPIDPERLATTVARLQSQVTSEKALPESELSELFQVLKAQKPDYLKWIKASKGEDLHLVSVDDICCFQAEDKYTTVFTRNDYYLIRTSLKDLLTQLDPRHFWQVHRSAIVRVSSIKKVNKDLAGRMSLLLSGEIKVAVSRSAQSLFKEI